MQDVWPPLVTEGSRVVIRRYALDDADGLHDAIIESVDHLRPWMPWASVEPLGLSDRTAKISEWIDRLDAGEDFSYAIIEAGSLVGGCGLRRRVGPTGLEMGYWTRARSLRRGVATDAARCLLRAAFALREVEFVEIHHDAANIASGRIPDRLGFVVVDEREDAVAAPGEVGVERVWRLGRDDWHGIATTAGGS